jgi:hypothetical protein
MREDKNVFHVNDHILWATLHLEAGSVLCTYIKYLHILLMSREVSCDFSVVINDNGLNIGSSKDEVRWGVLVCVHGDMFHLSAVLI